MTAVHSFRFAGFGAALLSLASFCLGSAAVACSSDDNHGPTIGAPTTPVVINEGGAGPGTAGSGNPNGGTSTSTGGVTGVAGTLATGATGGSDPFSTGGTDPFGTGGTGTSGDPFGVGGTSSSAAGTLSSFSGTSSF